MNSSDLLIEGVELMLLGMGSVFAFLIILVFVTGIMSRLIDRFFPEAAPVAKPVRRAPAAAAVDSELLAVIGAAVKQHRSRRRS